MPPSLRALGVVACVALTGLPLVAAESLPQSSPFVPPQTATTAASGATENHELAAISTIGKKTTVNIYDKTAKKGRWIAIGETVDGIKVLKFDPAREQVIVRIGNAEKTLALRQATAGAAAPAGRPNASGTPWAPPPGFATNAAPAPTATAEPVQIAPAVALPPTNQVPAPAPAPGSVAHQEQEARMLVSDLLEIGMAQRKAYEEAQRKAAEASQSAAPPSAPPRTDAGKP